AHATPQRHERTRRLLLRVRDWVRSRYGIRELILPEKYRIEEAHDVVVTYSSCLAFVYFADDPRPLELNDLASDPRRARLYAGLLTHPGVGLLGTRAGSSVHLESTTGRALITAGRVQVLDGRNPLDRYESSELIVRAVEHLMSQPHPGVVT